MISVALATYNGGLFIREQLDSIISQTYDDIEIIVCDDCSKDDTVKIIEQYAKNDSRIKIYQNEKNIGFKKNFEKAITLCSGEYIACSDQDDVWTNDHLKILYDNIGKYDMICANAHLVDEKLNPIGSDLFNSSRFSILPQNNKEWLIFLFFNNIFQGSACLIKKKLINKALPIPDNVKFHDYWFALCSVCNNGVKYLPNNFILFYRQHSNNITGNQKKTFGQKVIKIFNKKKNKKRRDDDLNNLYNLLNFNIDNSYRYEIIKIIKYFKRKYTPLSFLNILYFCKNYNKIYLSERESRFFIRLVKNIFM